MFVPREINEDDLSQIHAGGPDDVDTGRHTPRAGPRANLPAMRASSVLPSLTMGRARVSTPGIPGALPAGPTPRALCNVMTFHGLVGVPTRWPTRWARG